MNCDLTEKVSLLVDSELAPAEAAGLRAHVEGCAACQESLETFLALREGLRSYDPKPDPLAQGKALASILASRATGQDAAAPSAGGGERGYSAARHMAAWLGGRLANAPGGLGLRPAQAAALTLLLIVGALGLRWLITSPRPSHMPPHGVSRKAGTAHAPAAPVPGVNDERIETGIEAGDVPAIYRARATRVKAPVPKRPDARAGRRGGKSRGSELPPEVARAEAPVSPYSPASAVGYDAATNISEVEAQTKRVGRHAERVQILLRSFRNSRLNESDPNLDIAGARRLSKRLLYNNISLRREAASAGDLPVEALLSSVEPTLLDLANLPDKPAREELVSIKERIRKRHLVGVLQVQALLGSP